VSERSFCKSCLGSVVVSDDVIEELVKEAEEDKTKIVSEEVYAARLKICESCSSLQYGTTCAHSGSIVRYRAKFKNMSCPVAGTPKWEKIG
jgi:hypothetical protein